MTGTASPTFSALRRSVAQRFRLGQPVLVEVSGKARRGHIKATKEGNVRQWVVWLDKDPTIQNEPVMKREVHIPLASKSISPYA